MGRSGLRPGVPLPVVRLLSGGAAMGLDSLTYLLQRADELGIKTDYPKQPDIRTVTATSLNVRSAPTLTASIVGHKARGDRVTVLNTIGNWAMIGDNQWVSATYLQKGG